jgi:uncharacterized protein YqgV (UPF0045/DUF77 family)
MNNCSIAFQILPQINKELLVCGGNDNKNDVFRVVDEVIKYIDSTGVKYVVGPFETVMIGDYDELIQIVKEAQLIAINKGASSTLSYIKISYNPEGVNTIEEKTDKYK